MLLFDTFKYFYTIYILKMWCNVTIRQETKEQIKKCIPLYLEAHPELKGSKISINHILMQMAIYYQK